MLDPDVLQRVLSSALASGGDFAEIFGEERDNSSASLDGGRVESFSSGRIRGVGIRVVRGETTGFAHTTDMSEAGLRGAAKAAAAAAARGPEGRSAVVPLGQPTEPAPGGGAQRASVAIPPSEVPKPDKVGLLLRADDAARSEGAGIQQVRATYADARRRILVANSEGLLVEDEVTRTRLFVQCVALGDGGMQTGLEAPGRTAGFELFQEVDVGEVARTAARRALTMLTARPAPSGKWPVVLCKGAGGVLFHEACGHGLEADLVARDASVFRGRRGEMVASPLVTMVDDGTFSKGWGTGGIDDEGAPRRRNLLIESGGLADYMWDWLRARKEGRPRSGNGRRQSYQHLPMTRMTNTFVLAGADDPEEIVAQTPRGIYCVALGGGQVDTATGDFVFGITEAYMIEDGQITYPIRSANLIGNGPAVLRAVDAVGNDFETWTGTCGKDGQAVPVSAGQPTLRVAELTVGGTSLS
jgi:TldD protein